MDALRDRKRKLKDRVTAASLAGDLVVMNDDIAEILMAILRSPDEPAELRARAAISHGPALEQCEIDGFDDELSEPPVTEQTFHKMQETLQQIYNDQTAPKEVRRRALEASVRAPQDWHEDAVRAAYSSQDEEWKLTGAFAMQYVPDFEDEILELLDSRNPDIHYEAVRAAGAKGLDAAWPHIASLLDPEETDKDLLLAAIEAAGNIKRPAAQEALGVLLESDDEDISEAAMDALSMAQPDFLDEEGFEDEEDDEDDEDEDEDEWVH